MIRDDHNGATLVELLVALTILALLAGGMFAALRAGQRTYSRVIVSATQSRDIWAAQRLIRRIVESATPLPQAVAIASDPRTGLESQAQTLSVTAPSPGTRSAAGLFRYEIFTRKQATGETDVIVRSGVDRDGKPVEAREEILIPNVAAMNWSFRATPTAEEIQQGVVVPWSEEWPVTRRVTPALVRLQVLFPAKDRRRWPTLFIKPRITDSFDCQFDVVSQACRGA